MFYSHEVLTSRKYGVATVWLVATLGAKSNTKKVGKKAILDVDVRKACETIIEPEAPMALRLKSSLLYGVSRVYDQQCGYVLSDVQTLQTTMRGLLRIMRNRGLDLDAEKTKTDQLLLHDDPAFLPNLELPPLDFDLGALDWTQPLTSQMSPGRTQSRSRSSSHSLPEINIRSSSGSGSYQLPLHDAYLDDSEKKDHGWGRVIDNEPLVFEDDLDFEFMEDGQLRERDQSAIPFSFLQSASIASGLPMPAPAQSTQAQSDVVMYDPFAMDVVDDGQQLPDAAAFPAGRKRTQSISTINLGEVEISSAEAPQRKRRRTRKAKVVRLMPDQDIQISSAEIRGAADIYLDTMKSQRDEKQEKHESTVAKQHAYNTIFGVGLGNVAVGHGYARQTSALAEIYAGDSLFTMVTGSSPAKKSKAGRKAKADGKDVVEEEEIIREQSSPIQQDQIGRGEDDNMMQPDFEDEYGRQASNALEDHPSSVMPWNISASLHSHRAGSALLDRQSSVPLRGRSSRLTSASPLLGRGRIDPTNLQNLNNDQIGLDGFEFAIPISSDHGFDDEAAGFRSSTPQTAAKNSSQPHEHETQKSQQTQTSQLMREAMAKESTGFYEWVRNTIDEQDVDELEVDDALNQGPRNKKIGFDALITPEASTALVAATAFHHVLTLATKGLFTIQQKMAFGDIELGIRSMVV